MVQLNTNNVNYLPPCLSLIVPRPLKCVRKKYFWPVNFPSQFFFIGVSVVKNN
jgi:hypothetical protein